MDMIIHNGVTMTKSWVKRIEDAQRQPTVVIDGKQYARVRYGEDVDYAANRACHDCGVLEGQIHVFGCDVERCPACGFQVISCDCQYECD